MSGSLVALQADLFGPQTLSLLLVLAGLGLTVAEALAPGAHFIVLGVALLFAGVVGMLFAPLATPLALGVLVLLFGAVSLYVYREFDVYGTEAGRTTDSSSLRGTTGRVTERVSPTAGEVRLEGGGFNPNYAARSVDGEIPEGSEVVVTDPGGGNVLTVEAIDPVEDDIDRELRRERERRAREQPESDESTEREPGGHGDRAPDTDRERERERER
jgi:membrane protein implicated in regulation of membrane protease activity